MDGIAAAGELTALGRAGRAGTSRLRRRWIVESATPADDPGIRRLLRASVFPGDVGLTLEREPDSFAAAAIEGDVHQGIVARDRSTGKVVAAAGRSVRDAYVNGRPVRLGYLGQLRMDFEFRRVALLGDGFAVCRALQDASPASVHLLSVVADNARARKVLERRRPGWPAIAAVDRFVALALPVQQALRAGPSEVEVVRGREVGFGPILELLRRVNARYQFAPCWTLEHLQSADRTRDLSLDDFVVAVRGGELVGCVGCWDQRAFRQVVVRRYSNRLRILRRLINLTAPLTGAPRLPPGGRRLELAYLSHLAVPEEDPPVFATLIAAACRRAREKRADHVALGLPARGSLLAEARRRFAHRAYESILYVASWPGTGLAAADLDGRPANPELAIL